MKQVLSMNYAVIEAEEIMILNQYNYLRQNRCTDETK